MPFTITFVGHTPFWIAVTANTNAQTVSTSPTNYDIDVTGSALAKPKITIAASEALSNISIENTITNEKFSYLGSIGSTGSLVVDCDLFTVKKDDVDDIGNFSGDFLSIVNGTNSLIYTGGDCVITFEWNNRWF